MWQVSAAGIERLKRANPIEAVVAERGVQLKRKGQVLVGLCPFHKEKTASFTVYEKEGRFHCFGSGCGADGDVIGFVVKHDQVRFPEAARVLCRRAAIAESEVLEKDPKPTPRPQRKAVRTAHAPARGESAASSPPEDPGDELPPAALLVRAVDHYHRTFCQSAYAQAYAVKKRGLSDLDLLRALKVGYADGSLLKVLPRTGGVRDGLRKLGLLTAEDRELMGGCLVVPLPDPLSGAWSGMYGRGIRTDRHCYLSGPLRGVLNFQAARSSDEVILAESVLDAMSFLQAGISTAIPLYGTNGFTDELLDLLKRERVKRVILALDSDAPGRRTAAALKERLSDAGLSVRIASLPKGVKDPNELLVSCNGDAADVFRQVLDEAEPRPTPPPPEPPKPEPTSEDLAGSAQVEAASGPSSTEAETSANTEADATPLPPPAAQTSPATPEPPAPQGARQLGRDGDEITLRRDGITYRAHVHTHFLGRLRATVRVTRGTALHLDGLDLFASKSRSDFARKAAKALALDVSALPALEADLMALLLEAEKLDQAAEKEDEAPALTEAERAEALAFLKRRDLLDQVVRDVDILGFVGEVTSVKLLYLLAISRKLAEPLSAVILSQSGAGKSGFTEVLERLTPPEDVVLFTRLTPQSLYYTESAALDHKLVIIEERHGSQEADYSVRVLQSRGKLIAAAPIKDPATGNLRTRTFTVEARAAFIEATTASQVNHENATRCFEIGMDESVEQTRRIHARQRLMKTEAGLRLKREAESVCRRHWNAQRLLQALPVVIPFADQLTFPATWMRTRRDHARFLNLIEVSAFLHQAQRGRKDGAIVAAVEDYAVAYELAAQVLTETLTDVKKPLRDAYERLRALASKGDGTVSRREVREALAEPDSTVRRWLAELVELEYVEAEGSTRGGQGKSVRYRLAAGAPRGDVVLGLLTPENLRSKLGGR